MCCPLNISSEFSQRVWASILWLPLKIASFIDYVCCVRNTSNSFSSSIQNNDPAPSSSKINETLSAVYGTVQANFTFESPQKLTNQTRRESVRQTDLPRILENRTSLESLSRTMAHRTILGIHDQLSNKARSFFSRLLQLPSIAQISATSPIVSGDTDGSTARSILLGIQSGRLSISEEGQKRLLITLEAEAKAARNEKLEDFQKNAVLQNHLNQIASELTYSRGFRPLIFIGDVTHDRFSCNKGVDRVIREKMHAYGAVYIFGNHDSLEGSQRLRTYQGGKFALNPDPPPIWAKHEREIFVNNYYDSTDRTLYIHNGVSLALSGKETTIESAFGTIPASKAQNAQSLVATINKMNEGRGTSKNTAYRPKLEEIQKVAQNYSIRIVHGHDGDFNLQSKANVISLNSRTQGKFATSAVVIGTPREVNSR